MRKRKIVGGLRGENNGWKQYIKDKKTVDILKKVKRAEKRVKIMEEIDKKGGECGKEFCRHWKRCGNSCLNLI